MSLTTPVSKKKSNLATPMSKKKKIKRFFDQDANEEDVSIQPVSEPNSNSRFNAAFDVLPSTRKFLNLENDLLEKELRGTVDALVNSAYVNDDLLLSKSAFFSSAVSHMHKGSGSGSGARRKEGQKDSISRSWAHIPKAAITPEIQMDLNLLQNRRTMDSKRFYRKSGAGKKEKLTNFYIGTVQEGAHEFYSARKSKKERTNTVFLDDIMKDKEYLRKTKDKYMELQKKSENKYKIRKNMRKKPFQL